MSGLGQCGDRLELAAQRARCRRPDGHKGRHRAWFTGLRLLALDDVNLSGGEVYTRDVEIRWGWAE